MMYICNCIVHVHVSHNFVFAITVNCLYSCFFLFPRLEHPAGWICARYKSLLLLLLLWSEHFQQDMESVSLLKMNTMTQNYWLIYAAAMVNMTLSCGVLFSVTELTLTP